MIFNYHYNKPASKKAGYPKLTLHYKNTCFLVNKIICKVPTFSHNRKQQPHLIIKGNAKSIKILDDVAEIC